MMDNMKNLYHRAASRASSMTMANLSSTSAGAKTVPATGGSTRQTSSSSSNTTSMTGTSITTSTTAKNSASSSGGNNGRRGMYRTHGRNGSSRSLPNGSNSNSKGRTIHDYNKNKNNSNKNNSSNVVSHSGHNHHHKRKGRRPENSNGGGRDVEGEKRHHRPAHHEKDSMDGSNRPSHPHQIDISDDDHENDDDNDLEEEEEVYEEEVVETSSDDDFDDDDSDDDDDDGNNSVYTTITVETTRTRENENRKPTVPAIFGGGGGRGMTTKKNTQVAVGKNDPLGDLQLAKNDITKLSIYMKDVTITQTVATAFMSLMRGDDRSWEAIAVDILRQKARWESIVIEECSSASALLEEPASSSNGQRNQGKNATTTAAATSTTTTVQTDYLDLILTHILCVDNCSYLHLSNLIWTAHTAWSMQAMQFIKSMEKLQLDLIDLTAAIPMLALGLQDNRSLKVLITSRCGLQDEQLGVLLSHLPEQLEELRIFGNKCRSKGLASLTTAISKRTTHLQHLDLSYQHVSPDEEFDISWFAEALGSMNKTVRVLDLDNDSLDDGHLAHLIAALCKNKTLEELMLNHNKITGSGVAMLATKFGEMKGLKKISMYSNVFDPPSSGGGGGGSGGAPAGSGAAATSASTKNTGGVGGVDSNKNKKKSPTPNHDGNNQQNGSPNRVDGTINGNHGNQSDGSKTDDDDVAVHDEGSDPSTKHSSMAFDVNDSKSNYVPDDDGTPTHSNR